MTQTSLHETHGGEGGFKLSQPFSDSTTERVIEPLKYEFQPRGWL